MNAKMNKTLIAAALAAATLGVSTGAMALSFTDGTFDGGVDIGGDITVPVATNQWQWASGDAIAFTDAVTAMTNNYKTLTKPMAADTPLLVGQTKAATIGIPGAVGLTPQLVFKDATGNVVAPVWENAGNTGKGTMTLPVTAADGTTALGSMTMTVQAAGVQMYGNPASNLSFFVSAADDGSASNLFKGGVPDLSGARTSSLALSWITSLGAKNLVELYNDLAIYVPSIQPPSPGPISVAGFASPTAYFTGIYGLGIAQGDNIVVDFTNTVSTTTTWKAPLKMTVSYL